MVGDWISINSADGKTFKAYVSAPPVPTASAVVVIQEIFGVNPWLRSVADWLANEGYLAIAPDLFHRQEPNVQLTDKSEADWQKAFELYKGFDEDKGVEDLKSTIAAAATLPQCNGKVGSLGFCLGGKLAYLLSARSNSNCNVSFYGVGIEQNLSEPVRKPLLMHIAEKDAHVPPEAQAAIHQTLDRNELVSIRVYEGAGHAFGRPGSQHYDEKLAELARLRSLEFLEQHLVSEVGAAH